MKKQGIIITNGFSNPAETLWHVDRFREEFSALGVELVLLKNDTIPAFIEDSRAKSPLSADFVVYWDKDVHIARLLTLTGFLLFNSAESIFLSDDKMATYIALSGAGLTLPVTISSPLYYGGADDGTFLSELQKKLSFPIVVKENFGSFGQQVYLAENLGQLVALREKLIYKPHLYQEYLSKEPGADTRVMVIGGRVIAAMKRRGSDFRSNIGANGKGEPTAISEETERAALLSAETLGLDAAAVDFLAGEDGKPVLCEVNSNARFFEFERVTGVNYAAKFAAHVVSKIYKS